MSNESEKAEAIEWAKGIVADRAWVMHMQSRVVSRATKLFDGVDETYVSPINDRPVLGPVLQLDHGHAFLADPNMFVRLTEREAEYFQGAQTFLNGALSELVLVGAAVGIKAPTVSMLIISTLRTQCALLEAEHEKHFGAPPE